MTLFGSSHHGYSVDFFVIICLPPGSLHFSKVDVMKTQIQNKMYIVSGGLEPDDVLGGFRFFTKQGLSRVPERHMQKFFDARVETQVRHAQYTFRLCMRPYLGKPDASPI